MYTSDFWFLKIHHTDICKTSWEIINKLEIMKIKKIDHFLGLLSTRKSRIWQEKIISWQSAWKNEENLHLIFLIFEISSQRYLLNMLRDFQIMKNMNIAHFLGHSSTRNSNIWQIKIISWRSAWKNKANVHLWF